MTDLAAQPSSVALPSSAAVGRRRPSRAAIVAGTVMVAFLAGAALGRAHAADASGFESALVLLLRFMAACKAAGVVGAAALLAWRLGRPLGTGAFVGYVAALGLMAAAPGMIWSLGLIAPGALVFHAGLLTFLVLAARDDGVTALRRGRA